MEYNGSTVLSEECYSFDQHMAIMIAIFLVIAESTDFGVQKIFKVKWSLVLVNNLFSTNILSNVGRSSIMHCVGIE